MAVSLSINLDGSSGFASICLKKTENRASSAVSVIAQRGMGVPVNDDMHLKEGDSTALMLKVKSGLWECQQSRCSWNIHFCYLSMHTLIGWVLILLFLIEVWHSLTLVIIK